MFDADFAGICSIMEMECKGSMKGQSMKAKKASKIGQWRILYYY